MARANDVPEDKEQKSFLESKTVWGIIIAAGMPFLAKHGYIVDPTGLATDASTLLGAALAVYGRITAGKGLAIK